MRSRASGGRSPIDNKLYRFCANAAFGVCNWMVDAGYRRHLLRRLPA